MMEPVSFYDCEETSGVQKKIYYLRAIFTEQTFCLLKDKNKISLFVAKVFSQLICQ